MKKIGITTTVPYEVLITAGYQPVDLNNLFITSKNYQKYIKIAEMHGFNKSLCAWIKGIYGACIENDIKAIVAVTQGDCSNTKVLNELLETRGIKTYSFGYPHSHTKEAVKQSLDDFMQQFNVAYEAVEKTRKKLTTIRRLGKKVDEKTYQDGTISGFDNHLALVNFSDFQGDSKIHESYLINLLKESDNNQPINKTIRLGYIGVPPMTGDLYAFVLDHDAQIIYNEVQREFAFLRSEDANNIYDQYWDYTYPYGINFRIKELKKQINIRKLDGIIHYTQAFCYRSSEDIILKEALDVPILNIEGDKSNTLDARTKLRLEAFLDMLVDQKKGVF